MSPGDKKTCEGQGQRLFSLLLFFVVVDAVWMEDQHLWEHASPGSQPQALRCWPSWALWLSTEVGGASRGTSVVIMSLGPGIPEAPLAICVTSALFLTSLRLGFLLWKRRMITAFTLPGLLGGPEKVV